MPSRAFVAWHAVTSTTESPYRTMTEPSACFASLPVSNVSVLSPRVSSRVVIVESFNGKSRLFADVQALDQVGVALGVLDFEVVEEPPATADEHQQTAS